MFDPDRDFRCKACGKPKNVRTLRRSVCPECAAEHEAEQRAREEAAAEAAADRAAWREQLSRRLEFIDSWRPGDPQLLPGGEEFMCAACRQACSAIGDVSFIYTADKRPLFDGNTLCDQCYRKSHYVPGAA